MQKIIVLLFLFPHLLFGNPSHVGLITDFPPPERTSIGSEEGLPLFYQLSDALKERGILLELTDLSALNLSHPKKEKLASIAPFSKLLFWNMPHRVKKGDLSLLPKENMALFLWEPPTVQPRLYKKKLHDHFCRVFTWDDSLVDNKRYFKFHYPSLLPMLPDLEPFERRKLCTQMIGCKKSAHPLELYSEREKIVRFFEEKKELGFDLYGFGWDPLAHPSYKGYVEEKNKLKTLSAYRFAICYENMGGIKGYITEKIFNCFAAGTIPIYLGASNIEEYIPKECFIDRRKFLSDEALYTYLLNFSKEDYAKTLSHIRSFLTSEKARPFSPHAFIERVQKLIFCEDEKGLTLSK